MEQSVMMEGCVLCLLSTAVTTGHLWLAWLRSWNFYFILINFSWNSCMWSLATILNSIGLGAPDSLVSLVSAGAEFPDYTSWQPDWDLWGRPDPVSLCSHPSCRGHHSSQQPISEQQEGTQCLWLLKHSHHHCWSWRSPNVTLCSKGISVVGTRLRRAPSLLCWLRTPAPTAPPHGFLGGSQGHLEKTGNHRPGVWDCSIEWKTAEGVH